MTMFERLQKPFLTVETGEAYQPIRISYALLQADQFNAKIAALKCIEAKKGGGWNIYWRDECNDVHFESLDSFKKNPSHPVRLATLLIKDNTLYLNLPSFKRACLLVPLLHKLIDPSIIKVKKADFINKVFGLNERLPHGFAELFDEDELEKIINLRIHDYEAMQAKCENAESAEEALAILTKYTDTESHKRLPYTERYAFQQDGEDNSDIAYLGFYIFLRGRELVAIRRWFGETGYTLADAADDTINQVFGDMQIDILE